MDKTDNLPTWGGIATGFGEYAACISEDGSWEREGYSQDYEVVSGYEEAHRWLADHDHKIAAEALREAAEECPIRTASSWDVLAWLRERADRLANEREAGDE